MAQSIKKNFLYNILLNVSSVVFPLITAPYVSRVLDPDGVGLFNFSNTYSGYFALVALLGIPTYGIREVSKSRDNKENLTKVISQLMSIAVITTVCVSLIYFLTIVFVGQLTENYIIFLLAGFVIYLSPFKINWYYQGIEEFGFITFRTLVIKIISILCLFLFVHQKEDLIVYVILNVFSAVIADVWNFFKMWKSGIRPYFTLKGLRSHINPLLVLFASSIAISVYTVLDTLMLGFIKDYEAVGFYTNAMHMSKVILSAVTSLSIVAVPRVSYYVKTKDYDKVNDLMNKSFSFVSFLAFPIAIGMACISPTFVPLFFGAKFIGSVIPLSILSMLIIAIGLNNFTGVQILIGMGFDKLFLYSVLVGTVSNFVMNCFFIPMWGATGASIASVVAETLILFVTTYYVYHRTPVRIQKWHDIIKAFVGALTFIPILLILQKVIGGWILVGSYVLLCGITYLIVESVFRNSSVGLFIAVVKSKLTKKNEEHN